MPFLLIRNDITKVPADAIVNPANEKLRQGAGTSRGVYVAAGEAELTEACEKIGHCDLGKAVITEGFGLPARYVIHAVGPVWQGGGFGEDEILYSAYMEAMKLARRWHLESVAFPLLSSGSYGYPKDRALNVAIAAISDFLMENEMLIYLVVYDAKSLAVSQKLFTSIEEYIDEHYVAEKDESYQETPDMLADEPKSEPDKQSNPQKFTSWLKRRKQARTVTLDERRERTFLPEKLPLSGYQGAALPRQEAIPPQMPVLPRQEAVSPQMPAPISSKEKTRMLEDIMGHMGETFSQMLLRLIDERGMTDPEVYHKANIDRKLFSKIRTNVNYTPNKKTVLAFAIAIGLSLDETRDLLKTAGFSLSDSSRFDVIISFFLEHEIYDIFEINEMLFYYEQPILG